MNNEKRFFGIIKTNLKRKYPNDKEKRDCIFYKIQLDYKQRQFNLDQEFEEEDISCEIYFSKEELEKISIIDQEDRIKGLRKYYSDKNVFPISQQLGYCEEKGLFGRTFLHQAVVDNNLDAIKELIEDSDLEARDNSGYTPLMLAYLHEHLEIIALLEERIDNENFNDEND